MKINKMMRMLFIIPFMLAACSEFDNSSDTAKIRFLLTDAPGNFQEVNIDVQSIEVIINDSIIELETNQGIYNLLDFVNGKDTVLVMDEIPSGMLSQIRLILGENNTVMVDSIVYDIKTPSAQQSGLKLLVNENISNGVVYNYVIDFDAAKSIVKTGNGKYILKPVIRVFTEVLTGSIEGVVQPAEARPTVMAIGPSDDTTTVFTDTITGQFMIRGLVAGLYDLEFHPDTAYSDTTLLDIEVFKAQTTMLDTLWFQ
jgi:hypothetical protein